MRPSYGWIGISKAVPTDKHLFDSSLSRHALTDLIFHGAVSYPNIANTHTDE